MNHRSNLTLAMIRLLILPLITVVSLWIYLVIAENGTALEWLAFAVFWLAAASSAYPLLRAFLASSTT
jgi:hypothetical protein